MAAPEIQQPVAKVEVQAVQPKTPESGKKSPLSPEQARKVEELVGKLDIGGVAQMFADAGAQTVDEAKNVPEKLQPKGAPAKMQE